MRSLLLLIATILVAPPSFSLDMPVTLTEARDAGKAYVPTVDFPAPSTANQPLPGTIVKSGDSYFWQAIGSPAYTHDIGQPDRLELKSPAGQIVGYAWRMDHRGLPNSSTQEHVILASGFDVSPKGEPPQAGSVKSYIELANQLQFEGESDTQNSKLTHWLTNEGQNKIVWLIDYIDRQGLIQDNSKAVQALLKHPVYLSEFPSSGPASKSVLFGYSMGGLVARHALLSLESSGFSHNVGAYVSLDAPHRGAFLPPAIEAVVRTAADMLSGDTADPFKLGVKTYNSKAAKQLLGIYLGAGVPGNPRAYAEMLARYESIVTNNDVARDTAFYTLREELVDLGGYPSLPLNIGVSFGREDGRILKLDASRPYKVADWRIKFQNFFNTGAFSGHFKTIRGQNLCRVETSNIISSKGRSCPPLMMVNQNIHGVFTGPGSTSNGFEKFMSRVEANGDTGVTDVDRAWVDDSENRLTFVPTVSSFDASGWAAVYPRGAPLSSLSSPFDVLIADQGNDEGLGADGTGKHSTVTFNIMKQVYAAIDSANAKATQKMRIGSFGSPTSPTSDFWNNAGQFDIVRYIIPEHFRHLPVIRNAASQAGLYGYRDDQMTIAATISASQ